MESNWYSIAGVWAKAILCFIIFAAAAISYSRLPGKREFAVFDTSPPTPYFHYTPTGTSRGRILVVHGLDSNKNVMNVLCYALVEAGFEVFAMDLPGHGDSTASFTAFRARDAIEQVLNRLGPDTTVLGHSLGSALLLDIAGDRSIPTMVLFSPAPTPLDTINAGRVLVLVGEFDPGRIRAFVSQIRTAVTGTTEVRNMAWTGHSGGFFRPDVIRDVASWLTGSATSGHAAARLVLIATMLLSSLGLGWAVWTALPGQAIKEVLVVSPSLAVVYYVGAAGVSVGLLSFLNVTSWLKLFATDYMIGVLFVTGLLLLVRFRLSLPASIRPLLMALAAAAYVIGCVRIIAPEFTHVALSGDRWWRFIAIALLGLPLFWADEILLRPIRSAWKAAAVAIATRLVIGAAAVTGALVLNREAAFLLLMIHALIVFWISLWVIAGVVRARTSPLAAAFFAAVLQAWVFSTLFITT